MTKVGRLIEEEKLEYAQKYGQEKEMKLDNFLGYSAC
jgi:hypothetical protein